MIEHLRAWLLTLANSVPDRKGSVGVLKIYTSARRVPIAGNCLSLEKLIAHVGLDRETVVTAIGMCLPSAGTGGNVHVVITTPERLERDKFKAEQTRMENRDNQISNRLVYLRAAAIDLNHALPKFEPTAETVN